jgi:C4-dicarboxylate-specific signal transduction histidine kinase
LLLLAALIAERRQAERKLRGTEDLFSTTFMCSPDAIAVTLRSTGAVIEANDHWLDLMHYERGQLASGGVAPLLTHLDGVDQARLDLMKKSGARIRDVEVGLRDSRGTPLRALLSIAPVNLQGDACEVSILQDVTLQRQAELEAREQRQQLTHLTRVASLTDFSSTLAHELTQPLTAILSNAQAALRFLAKDPPNVAEIQSILREIADSDKRAGLIIQRLRLLMKKGNEEFVRLDVNQLLVEVLDFLRGEFLQHNVEVATSFSPDLPQVNGDSVQLQQLVLNLISNAIEAMRVQGGANKKLSITTLHGSDGTVQVVVSDTGPGIAADRIEKVFEPFFTTKQSGLGLGLAICRKIATAHGGTLVADDQYTEGASFRLKLPAALPSAALR